MNTKVLNDIKLLSACITSGGSIQLFVPYLDGNWINIANSMNGFMFSEAIKKHPFEEMTADENRLFVTLVKAGELGGVLEICLDRFVKHMENKNPVMNPIKQYLSLVGLLISCGVPILTAIKEIIIDPQWNSLKEDLYQAIMAGGVFTTPIEKYLPEITKEMYIAESSGYLPEYLMNLHS